MTTALFVTCLIDLLRPEIGLNALRLLEKVEAQVVVPEQQTCCGQPAFNAGMHQYARALAQKNIGDLAEFDQVIVPSGSCAEHIIRYYPELLAEDPHWHDQALTLAKKTREMCQYLAEVAPDIAADRQFNATVYYHDACSGLRGLAIKDAPRTLLKAITGINLVENPSCETCCGFGGLFAVKHAALSAAIGQDKVQAIVDSSADTVVAGDLGCLLQIESACRGQGKAIAVKHILEILVAPQNS